ncbi:MAG: hypothetical protein ACJ71Y_00280 [Blastococcus sp.]
MLELGKPGSLGYPKGELPVLRDGSVMAVLRASNWKEAATAIVGERVWVFSKRKGELTARWDVEPQDTARLRAAQKSFWKSRWTVDLEGRPVEMQNASMWRSTHRYLSGGKQVAESGTTGRWSPRPTLTADDALPLHQQVFLLWVELVLSRRNAAAAGGVAAATIAGSS